MNLSQIQLKPFIKSNLTKFVAISNIWEMYYRKVHGVLDNINKS